MFRGPFVLCLLYCIPENLQVNLGHMLVSPGIEDRHATSGLTPSFIKQSAWARWGNWTPTLQLCSLYSGHSNNWAILVPLNRTVIISRITINCFNVNSWYVVYTTHARGLRDSSPVAAASRYSVGTVTSRQVEPIQWQRSTATSSGQTDFTLHQERR